LDLLCEGVRGEWDREAVGGRGAPDGDNDVSGEEGRRGGRRGLDRAILSTAKVEEGLGLGLSANHAQVTCEELSARHEILTGTSNTKGDLANGVVAPAGRQAVVTSTGLRSGQGVDVSTIGGILKADDNVLQAITRRDNKRGTSSQLVGEVLAEAGVILHGDRLHLTVIRIRVVEVLTLAKIRKCARALSCHLY
jgi:hypothetical protein